MIFRAHFSNGETVLIRVEVQENGIVRAVFEKGGIRYESEEDPALYSEWVAVARVAAIIGRENHARPVAMEGPLPEGVNA